MQVNEANQRREEACLLKFLKMYIALKTDFFDFTENAEGRINTKRYSLLSKHFFLLRNMCVESASNSNDDSLLKDLYSFLNTRGFTKESEILKNIIR